MLTNHQDSHDGVIIDYKRASAHLEKRKTRYNDTYMANEVTVSKAPTTNIRANVVINLIRTLTLTVLSFITFPYITRALSDSVFGLYTWANTFVYYFLVLSKISIPNIAIRECAKVKDNKELLSKKVQEFFILQAIMTVLSFGFMSGIVFAVPALFETKELIFLLSINFLAGAFSFEWVYIALEKHVYITVRSIMLIAVAAMMTFAFVKPSARSENYVFIYALITISNTVFTAIFNCLLLPRYVSFKKTGKYEFKPLLKTLVVLFFISMALIIYNQTDEFILGFLDPTKAAVGAYSVGVKGIDIVITLITSLYMVFMPRASYYYEKEDKRFFQNLVSYSLNITFFIAIPAIATMATLANPITSLISGGDSVSAYRDANLVLPILALMMLTYSIADNIYYEILLPMKKEKFYLFAMTLGVIMNIGLSLLLGMVAFRDRPILGVAIATASTDVVLVGTLLVFAKKYAVPAVFNLNNLKITLAGIAIGVFTYFVAPILQGALPWVGDELWISQILTLVIMVGADAILYIGILLLCKEKLVSSFLPSRRKEREEYAKSQSEGE